MTNPNFMHKKQRKDNFIEWISIVWAKKHRKSSTWKNEISTTDGPIEFTAWPLGVSPSWPSKIRLKMATTTKDPTHVGSWWKTSKSEFYKMHNVYIYKYKQNIYIYVSIDINIYIYVNIFTQYLYILYDSCDPVKWIGMTMTCQLE